MEKRTKGQLKPRRKKLPENIIFGTRAVIEAVLSGKEFDRLFIQKNLKNELISELLGLLNQRRIPYSRVPLEKLNAITRRNHQGVIGYISPIEYASLDGVITSAFATGKDPLILVLDRITDIRNFGAVTRTAECTGVNGIVILAKGSAMVNSDAIKTSAGALNYLPVCRVENLEQAIDFMKKSGLSIVACTEKGNTHIFESDLKGPMALVMGSEEDGIQANLLNHSDLQIRLPLEGKISSLNVSVAAGVVLYEILRQRGL